MYYVSEYYRDKVLIKTNLFNLNLFIGHLLDLSICASHATA